MMECQRIRVKARKVTCLIMATGLCRRITVWDSKPVRGMRLIDSWIRWRVTVKMMLDLHRIVIVFGSKDKFLEGIMDSRGDWYYYIHDDWFAFVSTGIQFRHSQLAFVRHLHLHQPTCLAQSYLKDSSLISMLWSSAFLLLQGHQMHCINPVVECKGDVYISLSL